MSLLRHAVLSISGCFIVLGISTSTSGLATRPALQTVRVRIFADRSLGRMVVRSAYGTGVQIENSLVDGPVILRPSGRGIAVLAQPHAGAAAHGSHPAKRAIAPAGREFTRRSIWIYKKPGDLFIVEGPHGAQRKLVGALEVSNRGGTLVLINAMPAELYVLGIVRPELGTQNLPIESLKAQLVASRSYVMAMRGRHRKEGYDFCDTPHCQTFRGMASVNPLVIAAGLAVQGEYLSHHGRVVPAFFHDNCGGETTTPKAVWGISIPYLRGVRDGPAGESYCRFAPSAHWEKFVSRTRLEECLAARKIIAAGAPLVSVQVVDRDASGRARVLALKTDHAIRVPVRKFQAALNDYFGGNTLPSTLFKTVNEARGWLIVGRGWGHGVGMCQSGAIQMAKEGKTYQEILRHYYPETELKIDGFSREAGSEILAFSGAVPQDHRPSSETIPLSAAGLRRDPPF